MMKRGGGSHSTGAHPGTGEDGGVFEQSSFDAPNPAVDASFSVDPMFDAAVDPLAGKSGKDSLSGDEALLV